MSRFLCWLLGLCCHEFDAWKAERISVDAYGGFKIVQSRPCKKCGYTQISARSQ